MRPRPLPLLAALFALTLPLLAAACDSDGSDPTPTPQTLTVTATLTATATVGQNTLDIHVTDPDGAPVAGATVVVDPQMPSHGHGSTETPTVTDLGAGDYQAFPVTFQMKGPWVVHVTATDGAGREGSLDLPVEVN